MIKGIGGTKYFDLEPYLDMEKFETLQPEIYSGFARARHLAKEGTWMQPGFTFEDMSYTVNWTPIYKALDNFMSLSEDDPIKVEGMKLWPSDFKDYKQRNLFTRYLKMSMGASDPYIYYFLWEEGNWEDRPAERQLTEESSFFPNTVDWILNLKNEKIFNSIGRVMFFHCEHDGLPFEHRDLSADKGINEYFDHRNEFIHIRPNTKNQFYLWDPEKQMKYGLNTRAAWWNDQDWHGGNRIPEQSYGLRIDGEFTEEFRSKLGIDHLDYY